MSKRQNLSIRYLSHGKQVTGGYLHEIFLVHTLQHALGSDRYDLLELRQWRYFENLKSHIKLFWWAFKNSRASVVVCVSRLAIPVILRNLFHRNKILVVWHYHDERDGKKPFLRRWYKLLFWLCKQMPKNKLAFVVVAPFWEKYFLNKNTSKNIFLFPNFFDTKIFKPFAGTHKERKIHLGQESFKNSKDLYWLAEQLYHKGYTCYFSTMDPSKACKQKTFEIRYFPKFEYYLQDMASSLYTLALPAIHEGWNRVAHESLMVGTQVIGYQHGGLGDLLRSANALHAEDIRQVLELILEEKCAAINQDFLLQFDLEQGETYIQTMADWCEGKMT